MRSHRLALWPVLLTAFVVLAPCAGLALTVRVENAAAPPGAKDVPVAVTVDSAAGIAGADFTLTYDASALTPKEVQKTDLTSGFTLVPNLNTAGQVRVALASASAIPSGSGALVRVLFDVKAGVTPKVYPLYLVGATLEGVDQTLPVQSISHGTFTVSGEPSRAPDISLSTASLSFGNVQTGKALSLQVTVFNTGGATLSVTGITVRGTDASQFTVSPASATIAAGQSQTVTVTFAPISVGTRSASLSIAHNAAGSPSTVALSGVGGTTTVPDIDVSPLEIKFGDLEVRQSRSLTFVIANRGKALLTVSGIASSNEAFKASPATLAVAPGDSQRVTVTFTPSAAAAYSGGLTIISDDPDEQSIKVALSGNGALPTVPRIGIFPKPPLNFGTVMLGKTKILTLTVSNIGGGTLRVANIVSTSPDFLISDVRFDLKAGEEKALAITFSPSQTGKINETLNIPSNDPDSPVIEVSLVVNVIPRGTLPVLSVQVNALDFGQVDFGQSLDLNLPIRNDGTAPLNVSNITSDNVQVTVSPTSLAIQAGQLRTVTVTYRPQPLRERSGSLRITSDDPNQPSVKAPWTATEGFTGKSLSVVETSPPNGAVGVSLKTEVSVTFTEPVFVRKSFVAVDAALFPEPASGDILSKVRAEGRKVIFPVELRGNTFYRFVLFGATSASGAELDGTFSISFTTDVSKPVVGALSGTVSLSGGTLPRSTVLLFDQKNALVAQVSTESDGKYQFLNLPAGQYLVYAQGDLPDGGRASGASTRNPVSLSAGQSLSGVDVAMRVVDRSAPGANPTAGASIDLDPARENQRSISLSGIKVNQQFALAVYAEGVKDLIGYGVGVEYDTSKVAFVGADADSGAEKNLLKSAGGTMLFVKSPPKGNVVSIGGALLSPTAATAPDGGGLLGILRFEVLDSASTQISIPRVLFRSLAGRDTLEVNTSATISGVPPGPIQPKPGDGTAVLDLNTSSGDQNARTLGGVKPGQKMEVQIILNKEYASASAFQVVLTFDPKKLKVTGWKKDGTSFSSALDLPAQVKDNTVTYGASILGGSTTVSKGAVAILTFETASDYSGETEIVLSSLVIRVSGVNNTLTPGASIVLSSGGPAGLASDFDGNGEVGFDDFFQFAGAFGLKGTGENKKFDLDGDGDIGFGDFFIFAGDFGKKAGKQATKSVSIK